MSQGLQVQENGELATDRTPAEMAGVVRGGTA
jgi:hypothetical protein